MATRLFDTERNIGREICVKVKIDEDWHFPLPNYLSKICEEIHAKQKRNEARLYSILC